MGEKRFMISDASKMLGVESHVLRYWEEELEITIPRNEMGHRYYTDKHINLLRSVRDLKKQGYGLRAIKMMITDPAEQKSVAVNLHMPAPAALPEGATRIVDKDDKLEQFQEIMNKVVIKALKESAADLGKDLSNDVSENVLKGMDYLMRVQDDRAEERYKKLDEMMRSKQKASRKERRKKAKAEKLLLKDTKKKKDSKKVALAT